MALEKECPGTETAPLRHTQPHPLTGLNGTNPTRLKIQQQFPVGNFQLKL